MHRLIVLLALVAALQASADPKTLYVAPTGDDAQADVGTSWEKAYRNIQPAVDAAAEGDTVLVTNGTYYALNNEQTCVVTVTNGIKLLSVEGPSKTVIDGIAFKNGEPDTKTTLAARRIVHIKSTAVGAVFCGFTCTNGMHTGKAGGGICYGLLVERGVVSNVVVHLKWAQQASALTVSGGARVVGARVLQPTSCSADEPGLYVRILDSSVVDRLEIRGVSVPDGAGGYGLVYLGDSGNNWTSPTLRNSIIADNVFGTTSNSRCSPISLGTKNISSVIENCTFVNNRSTGSQSFIYCTTSLGENCWKRMCFYNNIMTDWELSSAPASGNPWLSANFITKMTNMFYNCCCQYLPTNGNNIAVDPKLDAQTLVPEVSSKCVNGGVNRAWVTNAVDFAGQPRLMYETVDIGALECQEDPSKADLGCGIEVKGATGGNYTLTTTLKGYTVGYAEGLTACWTFSDGTTSTDWPEVTKTFAKAGLYSVTLCVTNELGQAATNKMTDAFTVRPAKCYVKAGNEDKAAYPYDTWENATPDVKVACATALDEVEIGDGSFTIAAPSCSFLNALDIHSSNGRAATTLTAEEELFNVSAAGTKIRDLTLVGGIGSAYHKVTLFTLSNTTISNCLVKGRYAFKGGASSVGAGCYLVDSIFDFNKKDGPSDGENRGLVLSGTAEKPVLMERCRVTGGVFQTGVSGNLLATTLYVGSYATVRNCLIDGNKNMTENPNVRAPVVFVTGGTLENCTVVSNSCGSYAAGVILTNGATCVNTIVALNTANHAPSNLVWASTVPTDVRHTLSPDAPSGNGNFIAEPSFKKGTLYLRANTPGSCGGEKLGWMTPDAIDFAGNRRVIGGSPDVGCLEAYNPGLLLLVR